MIILFIVFLLGQMFFVPKILAQSPLPGTGETPAGTGETPSGSGCTPSTDTWTLPNPLNACSFEDLVMRIANWLYMVMIPLSTIMILYAAFLFMTSAGDEEKIKKARRALTWALVGIGIIIIGAGFVSLIRSILETSP